MMTDVKIKSLEIQAVNEEHVRLVGYWVGEESARRIKFELKTHDDIQITDYLLAADVSPGGKFETTMIPLKRGLYKVSAFEIDDEGSSVATLIADERIVCGDVSVVTITKGIDESQKKFGISKGVRLTISADIPLDFNGLYYVIKGIKGIEHVRYPIPPFEKRMRSIFVDVDDMDKIAVRATGERPDYLLRRVDL